MTGPYDDIIHLPHHVSAVHPPMPVQDRAAQFAPFAALTGYDALLRESGRLTELQIELQDDDRADLDRKQTFLRGILDSLPPVSVTHFVPDSRKAGGHYITTEGHLKKIDEYTRRLVLSDGTTIALDYVTGIESERFPDDL